LSGGSSAARQLGSAPGARPQRCATRGPAASSSIVRRASSDVELGAGRECELRGRRAPPPGPGVECRGSSGPRERGASERRDQSALDAIRATRRRAEGSVASGRRLEWRAERRGLGRHAGRAGCARARARAAAVGPRRARGADGGRAEGEDEEGRPDRGHRFIKSNRLTSPESSWKPRTLRESFGTADSSGEFLEPADSSGEFWNRPNPPKWRPKVWRRGKASPLGFGGSKKKRRERNRRSRRMAPKPLGRPDVVRGVFRVRAVNRNRSKPTEASPARTRLRPPFGGFGGFQKKLVLVFASAVPRLSSRSLQRFPKNSRARLASAGSRTTLVSLRFTQGERARSSRTVLAPSFADFSFPAGFAVYGLLPRPRGASRSASRGRRGCCRRCGLPFGKSRGAGRSVRPACSRA